MFITRNFPCCPEKRLPEMDKNRNFPFQARKKVVFMNPCNELIELGVKMPEAPVTTEDMTEG